MAGDLRCLYLGWLLGVDHGEVEEDAPEPPVPPGMQELTPALNTLVKFLMTACETVAETNRRRAAEKQARQEARRAREQAEAWTKYLAGLAEREPSIWQQVETLIDSKQPKAYDQAVVLLKDLRDLAEWQGRKTEAEARIRQLRERHSSKSSLKRRLNQAGLTGGAGSISR
jgi:hypothetical protein